MKIENLFYIMILYDEKSLNKASVRLNMTIKTLIKKMKELESELGQKLFKTTSTGIIFTDAGYEFYSYASNILASLHTLKIGLNKVEIEKEYTIAIECKLFMNNVLEAIKEVEESVKGRFNVKQFYREEILRGVLDNKYPVGIIALNKIVNIDLQDYGIKFTPLYNRKPAILLSENHPLAYKDEISLKDLEKYKRISFENPFDNYYNYYYGIKEKYGLEKENIYVKYLGDILLLLKRSELYFIGGINHNEEKLLNGIKAIPIKEIKDEITVGYITKYNVEIDDSLRKVLDIVK